MKKTKRILALVLACALVGSGSALYAAAESGDQAEAAPATEPVQTVSALDADAAAGKDETVYVLAGADGTPENVIVSDFLSNPDGAASLEDYTNLTDLETVRGDATFTLDGDRCVWDAQGEDVYYQGTTQQTPPVSIAISYQLDGQPISAAELAGKSGHVTIRFDYTNELTQTVTCDGETQTVHVPFAVLTGLMMDNDTFRNITVTNGKLINDGSRTIVVGVALPGLQDDLGLDPETLTLPEYVEISADATEFSLETTLTLASSEVFAGVNDEDSLDTTELTDSLDALSEAMTELLDGSSALSDGLAELLEKSGDLTDGVDALVEGADSLQNGAKSLQSGASELQSGLGTLSTGLDTLSANNPTLTAGAKTVFDTLLQTVQGQITAAGLTVPTLTVDNYATVLNGLISSLDGVTAQAMAQANTAAREQVTAAVRPSVLAAVLKAQGLTEQAYGALPEAQRTALDAAVDAQMETNDVQAQIDALVAQAVASDEVQAQIAAAAANASAAVQSLTAAKAQLDSYNAFYSGLVTYTNGVSNAAAGARQLAGGSKELATGAATLSEGAATLYAGTTTLQTGTDTLIEGVQALSDGASQLSNGLTQFNDEGLSKILALADEQMLSRLKAMCSAAQGYKTFSGCADGVSGSVRFVYRTASIGA